MNRGYRVPAASRSALRDTANVVRQALGLASQAWFPIVEVYEWRLPQVWEDFHFEVVEMHQLGDEHAIAYPSEARIVVREDVYERACNDEERDRYTLCHELGHVVLEHAVVLTKHIPNRKPWNAYEDSEWQADAFAAELLMPVTYVKRCRTPDELARSCGVSVKAAITQRKLLSGERLI